MLSERLNAKTRRDFMKLSAAGVFGASLSGWMNVLAAHSAKTGTKAKSCILLWMDGGPSHKDTFDMKPDSKGAGEFSPISTAVPGLQISEHLPKLAKQMQLGAVIRGMSTGEGAHGRAKYYLHTGYKEGVGGLSYPSLGAIVSAELGREESALPNFVTIGNRSYGAGFLGPKHQPLVVRNPKSGVENLKALVDAQQFQKRVSLLAQMESAFHREYQADTIIDHRTNYARAVRLMTSKEAKAFDLSQERDTVKGRYGSGNFAEGCLMARRLVEVGVPFVEVVLGGWDTHRENFDKVKSLSGQIDSAMSALLMDLQERGLLDSTLVIWMGEFGRTPHVTDRFSTPGRDHYPKAWSLAMFGGGIPGGQVIGKTDKEGARVEERSVSALDFMATVCSVLGIDYTKENDTPIGRPIRLVDKGAKPIEELIG